MSVTKFELPQFEVGEIESVLAKGSAKPSAAAAPKSIRRRFSVRTPAGKRSNTWVTVVHEADPRKALLDKIGTIPEGVVLFSRILVAIYVPPIVERTGGGVFIASAIQDEDREESLWQGKTGLVVAMGPQAYVDDGDTTFHGQRVDVGDWVWFRPSDGMGCDINETPCRLFDSERYIIGKLPHPDMAA